MDQIDRIKSKIGIGNNGRLMGGRKKKKKKKKEEEEVSEARIKLREKWYKRFGLEYER